MFGWRIALLYMSAGLSRSPSSTGLIIGRLNMERQVEDWVYEIRMGQAPAHLQTLTWMGRIDYGFHQVKEIVGRVWIYIILGIGAGAAIHGYIPACMMAQYMGGSPGGRCRRWFSSDKTCGILTLAGVIPIVEALMGKGAALGTTLAFMMSIIGISLPGSGHPPEGLEAQADRGLHRGGDRGDYHRRLYLQCSFVREACKE